MPSKCLFEDIESNWVKIRSCGWNFSPQIPLPTWPSPTRTTTDLPSAQATQLRTQFQTSTTTGTTTTASPTTIWPTQEPTRRSTTTREGENEVCEGLSKNSEKGRWRQFMKNWSETFKEKRRKREQLHKVNNDDVLHWTQYIFSSHNEIDLEVCCGCFHCEHITGITPRTFCHKWQTLLSYHPLCHRDWNVEPRQMQHDLNPAPPCCDTVHYVSIPIKKMH